MVILTTVLWTLLADDPLVPAAFETDPTEGEVIEPTIPNNVDFEEGYSITLPDGFEQESREKTDRGYTLYRFRNAKGFRFTLAIIPSESTTRYTNPPSDFADAIVPSIPELSQGAGADVQPSRETLQGMPATVFRFYEKETFRGVNFIYHMVALDRDRKLVLNFTGKYGDYGDNDEIIAMPNEWYESLLTLHRRRTP